MKYCFRSLLSTGFAIHITGEVVWMGTFNPKGRVYGEIFNAQYIAEGI